MSFVIQKRKKYMTGRGYATGFGASFSWSSDIGKAQRFIENDGIAQSILQETGGKLIEVPSTRKELKALGKRIIGRVAA
jgi:hypothetical protein